MNHDTELLQVVGRIYDGVFDRDARPDAVAAAVHLMKGCAGTLLSHSLPDQIPERATEYGNDRAFSLSYAETYSRINPLFAMSVLDMAENDVRTLRQHVDLPKFEKTRFFREWFAPQGWGDWACLLVARTPNRISQFVVARPAGSGDFSADEIAKLGALSSHFRRAAALGRLIGRFERRELGFTSLLDGLKSAALLVDDRGRVEFVNAQGEAAFASGDVMSVSADRRLNVRDVRAMQVVRDAISGRANTPDSVTVTGANGKITLSTLPPSQATGEFATVLLSARDPIPPPPGPILSQLYGVTPAESEVLRLLVAGQTVLEIADALDVTPRTVRAHVQSLFAKTGVSRQVDLVREIITISARLGA